MFVNLPVPAVVTWVVTERSISAASSKRAKPSEDEFIGLLVWIFGSSYELDWSRGPSDLELLSLTKEMIRLSSGWQVMRHAQMMPMDCSMVLHIEALTIVYVISGKTTSLKVITRTIDATQALCCSFLVSDAALTWIEGFGEECKTYKRPNRKTNVRDSFWRVCSLKCQINGIVRVRIMKSISKFATPFQR